MYIAILLIFDFCDLLNLAVNNGFKACFVGSIVFVPTVVLLYQISFQHIFKPKTIALQGTAFLKKAFRFTASASQFFSARFIFSPLFSFSLAGTL